MAVAAVVLSDLHLGAPNSVLNLREWPHSEVAFCKHGAEARGILIDAIAAALAGDSAIDRLVLNGDIIDLSHGTISDGIRELGTLLRDLRAAFTIGEIVLIPGNHDRQWWDWQCQYDGVIRHLIADREAAADIFYRRTTDTGGRTDADVILKPLHEHADITLRVAYPDYQFGVGGRLIRVHHGHLFEDLYSVLYSALLRVLEDYEDPKVRDRVGAPPNPLDSPELKQIRKSGAHFGDCIRRTLGVTNAKQRCDLEMLERVCAPFINLDWVLLGQTGLLQHTDAGACLGRAVFEWTAREKPFEPDYVGVDHTAMKNPFQMFMVLFSLGVADFLKQPPMGDRHAFAGPGIKAAIDHFVAIVSQGSQAIERPAWKDPSAMSLHRLRKLQSLAPAISRHAARFYSTLPATYIVGHTHVPGDLSINVRPVVGGNATMRTLNTGGWVTLPPSPPDAKNPRPPAPPDAAFVVVAQDGNASAPVLLQARLA